MIPYGTGAVVLMGLLLVGGGWPTTPDHEHPGRQWHHIRITEFRDFTQSVGVRHVCTAGLVALVRKESDGDWHIRLEVNQPKKLPRPTPFVVLKIIPEVSMARPDPGTTIEACGIIREDRKHGWYEVHPLLQWRRVP